MSRSSVTALAVAALLSGTALSGGAAAGSGDKDPKPAASLSQNVEAGLKDAQAKRLSGDLGAAVKVLSQLMLINADDPRVVTEYGKVLVQQGRSREALDFLGRATQLNSNDWSVFSALGVAYDATGDYANAKTAYDRALMLKPGEAVVLNNYALSRAMAGDPAQAKTLILEASAHGNDPRIARNLKMISALPAAGPISKSAANAAQRPASKPVAVVNGKPVSDVATGAPRPLTTSEGNQVVMQAVPADPKAGPISKRKAAASAKAPAKTAKQSDGVPALRLANDKI